MPSKKRLICYGVVLVVLACVSVWIRLPAREPPPPAYYYAKSSDLEWFKQARFGLMITWGPASLAGTEISWSRKGPRPGRDKTEQYAGTVPLEEYDQLYRRFNPVGFDPAAIVRVAQAAGVRYLVWVTKHHDGFCMFDSALTDYKITRSPIQRDLTAEVADACHRAGLRLGFYFSPPDWHHPDYSTPRHDQFIRYLHGQMRELCTRYGKVDLVWFDGLFWRDKDWDADGLFKMVRGLQPGILLNDRAGLIGDFQTLGTELVVGDYNDKTPWETSMTLGGQWSYKPGDKRKSAAECIRYLVRCAGAGGNFLLNISLDPQGRMEPEVAARLEEIGRWMARNGRSIYGTRAGPFRPGDWGVCTHRQKTIYLHVLDPERAAGTRPADTRPAGTQPSGAPASASAGENLSLPALKQKIRRASTLDGRPVQAVQSADEVRITLPAGAFDGVDAIVELQVETPVE